MLSIIEIREGFYFMSAFHVLLFLQHFYDLEIISNKVEKLT
jgi:hypothetical protein